MKKFVAMLCVAGLLTGCAVSGEKKTDEVKPEAPAQTEETKEETAKPEEKTETAAETENEGDEHCYFYDWKGFRKRLLEACKSRRGAGGDRYQ